MKKRMFTVCIYILLTAPLQTQAAAYKIPEQSVNSTALSGAYIANANAADASYFNPANISWLANTHLFEGSLTYINLSSIHFAGTVSGVPVTGDSKTENFLMPSLFYVSPEILPNLRYGVSLTAPAGLSKRWDQPLQKATAEEFSFKTFELNPVLSYKVNSQFSLGGGLRVAYAKGQVKNQLPAGYHPLLTQGYQQSLEGDVFMWGYNFALSYKPAQNTNLSVTYRSKLSMDLEGDAEGFTTLPSATGGVAMPFSGDSDVSAPIPATWAFAIAQTFDKTTLELVYERNLWSAYDKLDFNYANPVAEATLGVSRVRNWSDSNTYRLGITQQINPSLTLMGAIAYDESPAPEAYLGFELPDSDAWIFSLGLRYQMTPALNLGASYLYDKKDDRDASNSTLNGSFSDSGAHLFSVGFGYAF